MTIEFRLLGPVEVSVSGRPIAIAGIKRRAVLALLMLHANEPVGLRRLLDRVWNLAPPPTAEAALRNYVSALRKRLRDAPDVALDTVGQGYRLRIPPESLDCEVFRGLHQRGRLKLGTGEPAEASSLLTEALDLWRGPALADLVEAGSDWPETTELEELRLSTIEDRIEADLMLGRHRLLVAELERLIRAHPGRETLYRQHMVALYRAGRQAHALAAYQNARTTLLDRAGHEPGETLREVYQSILEQRSDLMLDGQAEPTPPDTIEVDQRTRVDRVPLPRVDVPGTAPQGSPAVAAVHPQARDAALSDELRTVAMLYVRINMPPRTNDADTQFDNLLPAALDRIRTYGGRAEQTVGSTILASFGVPHAHENDPERAVRAALAIRRLLSGRRLLGVRSGAPSHDRAGISVTATVTSGTVLVRQQSATGGNRSSIVGKVVDDCLGMMETTTPGVVRVSQDVFRATRRTIRYARSAPGGSTWAAMSRMRTADEGFAEHPITFVDRKPEMGILSALLEKVGSRRQSHLVTLIGPAGIGKSRLVLELLASAGSQGRPVRWYRARTPWYAHGPDAEILEEIGGSDPAPDEEPSPAVVTRVPGSVSHQFDNPRSMTTCLMRLASSSGAADPAGGDQAWSDWHRLLDDVAVDSTVVLVFEDLHRATDDLLNLVENLADQAGSIPLLVIATARQELLDRRPRWAGGKRNAVTLTVPPLRAVETLRLLSDLLSEVSERAPVARARASDLVLSLGATGPELFLRIGGNPLFAIEYAHMLEDLGVWPHDTQNDDRAAHALPMPDTVHGVIAARLDSLGTREKAVLRAAAVLGNVFWLDALVAMTGYTRVDVAEALAQLESRDLVGSVAGDAEYTFTHVQVQEVAYERIPRTVRAEIHRHAGRWMEQNLPANWATAAAHHHGKSTAAKDTRRQPPLTGKQTARA
jgi:DNA-binding SARP family transcriptional activator